MGQAMHRRWSWWVRAVVGWTAAMLILAIALALVAVTGLYDAQQACFFDTSVPCPSPDDWRVGLLGFALVGVPAIWLVGMVVAFAVRDRSHARRG